MKVLVACEFSGTVRDAFIDAGHDAVSCDLLPTESPGPHYQDDVSNVLDLGWDLVIAHPPCTYLSNSGVRWLFADDDHDHPLKGRPRWDAMRKGAEFFKALLNAPADRVAVENPIMHKHARKIVGRGPDQTVQPYEHGDPFTKRTGLWLRGLPKLVPTNDVEALMRGRPKSQTHAVHYASPGPDRWKARSVTYPGIARAMAEQWG